MIDKARVDKKYWVEQRYKNGCVNIWLVGLLSNPAEINKLLSADIRADTDKVIACGP